MFVLQSMLSLRFSEWFDTDGDGIRNEADPDDDGDGLNVPKKYRLVQIH